MQWVISLARLKISMTSTYFHLRYHTNTNITAHSHSRAIGYIFSFISITENECKRTCSFDGRPKFTIDFPCSVDYSFYCIYGYWSVKDTIFYTANNLRCWRSFTNYFSKAADDIRFTIWSKSTFDLIKPIDNGLYFLRATKTSQERSCNMLCLSSTGSCCRPSRSRLRTKNRWKIIPYGPHRGCNRRHLGYSCHYCRPGLSTPTFSVSFLLRALPLSEPRVDTLSQVFWLTSNSTSFPGHPFPTLQETPFKHIDLWLWMHFFKDAIYFFDRDKFNSGKESEEKKVRINYILYSSLASYCFSSLKLSFYCCLRKQQREVWTELHWIHWITRIITKRLR